MSEERRLDPDARVRFEQAVEAAASRAAQRVAQLHRRRIVLHVAITVAVVMAMIGVPVVAVVANSERTFGQRNSEYDCRLFKKAAGLVGDFVLSDARLRTLQDRQGLSSEIISGFEKIIRRSTLLRLARLQRQQAVQTVNGWRVDGSRLQALGGTDCAKHLSG